MAGQVWSVPSDSMVIRRYTSLEYTIGNLSKEHLHFSRGDGFEDEGTATEFTRKDEKRREEEEQSDMEGAPISLGAQRYREISPKYFHLSCWRLGTDELAWHWNYFGKGDYPVAIETTVGQLRERISHGMNFGMVWYAPNRVRSPTRPPATFFRKPPKNWRENEFRIIRDRSMGVTVDARPNPTEPIPQPDPPDESTFCDFDPTILNRVVTHPGMGQDDFSHVRREISDAVSGNDTFENLSEVEVTRSRLDWDREPGPSHMMFGNKFMTGGPATLTYQIHSEITKTDWRIWDTVDLVVVTPEYGDTSHSTVTTYGELYRYRGQDVVPSVWEYGRADLNQEIEIVRYYSPSSLRYWILKPQPDSDSYQVSNGGGLEGLPALDHYVNPRLTRYPF